MLLSIIKSTCTDCTLGIIVGTDEPLVGTDEPLVATTDTDKEDGMKKEDVIVSKGFWKNKEKYITGKC